MYQHSNNNMSSLSLLANYESDDEESIDCTKDDSLIKQDVQILLNSLVNQVVARVNIQTLFNYRTTCNSDELLLPSSDDDSSSLSSWSLASDLDDDDASSKPDAGSKGPYRPPKTKGELDLDDLPPIQHLNINVQTDNLVHLGRVITIVDRLVTVQSFKNTPALDLDSALFLKSGRPLGTVFDVFGRVSEPIYVIRFNSVEEIASHGVKVDTPVYYVPTLGDPLTKFVFLNQLMQEKGSDASWENNNEPPDECKDYSDDEQEREAKRKAGKKRNFATIK